jgi:diguanylate cyclase (GGDEF)-like protein/excisionase family DNA binding protein
VRLARTDVAHEAEALVDGALARARATGATAAVLLVDVDGIDELDRAFGHDAGAGALGALAERLRDAAPPGAAIAPFTRDRFVLALDAIDDALAATRLAELLAVAAGRPLAVRDLHLRLTTTIGIGIAPGGAGEAAELLRDADAAAHRARELGGIRTLLADPAARERSLRRLRLEDELGVALQRRELTLHFQPIVSLRGGRVLGVEALVRWRHPTRGLVGADRFVPVAERSGLIVEIGDWVLGEVLQHVGRWAERHPGRHLPRVSVNVSARELGDAALVSRLTSALAAARIPAQSLTLEIAEAGAADPSGRAHETLEALRRLGVQLVLDRFGGGHSALARLAHLPVDGIKLDRTFIGELARDPRQAPVVEAIVELGHALGLTVTAPGIETAEQLAALRALSVDAAQGHLIARPAAAATLPDLDALELDVEALAHRDPSGAAGGEELVGLSAAAAALGVSTSTVRRLADQGVLRGTRTEGGHRRFRRAEVQRLARERGRTPLLRRWVLPTAQLENVAMVVEHEGTALAERAARAIYDPHRPGWFAEPPGLARARQWLEALGGALASGTSSSAIEATVDYLDAATLAGATPAECSRFVGQFATVAMHELVRMRAPVEEVRALQRIASAATEAFLERLAR